MDRESVTDLGYTPIGGMDTTTRNVMKHNSLLMLRRPRRQLHTVAQMVGFVGSVFWLRCTLRVCVCMCLYLRGASPRSPNMHEINDISNTMLLSERIRLQYDEGWWLFCYSLCFELSSSPWQLPKVDDHNYGSCLVDHVLCQLPLK